MKWNKFSNVNLVEYNKKKSYNNNINNIKCQPIFCTRQKIIETIGYHNLDYIGSIFAFKYVVCVCVCVGAHSILKIFVC